MNGFEPIVVDGMTVVLALDAKDIDPSVIAHYFENYGVVIVANVEQYKKLLERAA